MTDIYVRALNTLEPLSRFLCRSYREDARAKAANQMKVWDGRNEDWARIDATTPGLASLRFHHLDRSRDAR